MFQGPLSPFRRAATDAVAAATGLDAAQLPVTTPPEPALGDYAVGCFPAAKALRAAPAQIARNVAAGFLATDLLESAEAAGPYVNFRARRAALYRHLFAGTESPIPPVVGAGQTVVIDFSSPNIAKHLAYHHIRSTVIGNALGHMHRALGYRVVGINHLGDWGTTFGMLLAATERWGAPDPLTIAALNDLYVRFRAAMKEDPALEARARAWFKRLEDGDAAARATWQGFREVSLAEFQEVYDLLGVRFDEVRGESEYESAMPGVIRMLTDKGLTSTSDDALVVDLSAEKLPPLLLRKTDGATLYATRDLAAAMYRFDRYAFDRLLYVVDRGQGLHFQQLFLVLKKAGLPWADRLLHVGFGLVRLGGKKTGTRSGNVVLLRDVLEEAQRRVAEKIRETNPGLTPDRRARVARQVGVGAVVFANLASQREKDVDFDWDDVLSFEGDSGPYVQYAHARAASILAKAGALGDDVLHAADPTLLVRDEEWALALTASSFPDEVARAAASAEPHIIARYLLDLCAAFSRWYTVGNQDPALRVLCADQATSRARLALTASTKAVLRTGLGLLGMEAPEEM